MRYEVYSINGLQGVARTLKRAMKLTDLPANTGGKFVILIKERKNSCANAGISGQNGIAYRHTMLLYPKGALCKQYTAEEWLKESLA